jgi:Pyruvate/2-oxoacid:ferredoxin oxidoreductase delta subunit
MSLRDQKTLRVVLADSSTAQTSYDALTALLNNGYAVTCNTGERSVAPVDHSDILVLGNFAASLDAEDPNRNAQVTMRDIKGCSPQAVLELVESVRSDRQAVKQGEWKPWFPVIDYDRCTNCMQCLSFCLFYGVDEEQKLQVQNQDSCKTNCPACSRVCPEAAIMFPKYKSGPINGEPVTDADLQREKMKIDISALLGGDVYAMLRTRSERAQTRFSKERDADKALKERQRCLVKLAQMGDIPPEVLMALPSPEEIARRSEEAKAKAAAALEGRR